MDPAKVPSKVLAIRESVPCNLCGSKSFHVIFPARYNQEKDFDLVKKFRASGDELLIDQLVKCSRCGLVFVSPRIKSNKIVDAYSEGEDPLFISQAASREKTFSDSLKNIEKYTQGKRVLDVGTAGGSFLAAAKKRGWEVYGCEPNRWLAKWGKKNYGIDIKPGILEDQKYKSGFFDLVTLWDVIEHTPDPLSVLKECHRVMKDKGILVVNYPDIDSIVSKLMGRKWLFLTSVHLYYFTRKTMTEMLNKAGFEVIKIRPHFQKLKLGYVIFRAATYSKLISSVAGLFAGALGIKSREVPYWLGQTFVIARKK